MALVGRSNVGKSSLINALLGRRALARTSRTPGKTRTLNVFDVDGRFYLVDLPGYGYARVSLTERRQLQQLLQRYLAERPRLAGVVWLLDIRHPPSRDDLAMGEQLAARGVPVLAALTKADKISRARRGEHVAVLQDALGLGDDQVVVTSTTAKEGITELWQAIETLA